MRLYAIICDYMRLYAIKFNCGHRYIQCSTF